MIRWNDGSEERHLLNTLGDEFQCISVDEEILGFSIDFEIKYL